MAYYVYWKEEKQNRKWKLDSDTENDRKQAIASGAMYFTWASVSHPYNSDNQNQPIRKGDFPLDFDNKNNPENALQNMKTLCLYHLPEYFDVDPYDMQFFCSGSKGFHAVIPADVFGAEAGDPYLPLIYKKIAAEWASKLSLKTLDMSMYCMGKGKMFRIPNVRRSNGRYKVPLTVDEVTNLSIHELFKLSEAPRTIDDVDG
jgi:hypothetical protein